MKDKIKPLKAEITIPPEIEVEINGDTLIAKKGGKETKKKIHKINISKNEDKLILTAQRSTKREIKLINSAKAHIKNIFKGFNESFIYKLEICAVHFPMSVAVKDNYVIIKNFLGETKERKAKILPNANVNIEKNIIIVESHDKEAAGQTAGNIEKKATCRNKDRRIFQDGIFMTEKAGNKI